MKYLIRLNKKAFNPVTKRVIPGRIWEVEQVANKDSEKVIWHIVDTNVTAVPIRELFDLTPEWEYTCFGICVRGQDNAIEIKIGRSDVSGN